MVAVLLGLRAHAELHEDDADCGATDIDAPDTPEGTDRLLVALVAGSEAEGRLLGGPRQWRVSLEDARMIVRLIGGLSDDNTGRLGRAKQSAEQIVRDPLVWWTIGEVAAALDRTSSLEHEELLEAVRTAGLAPATFERSAP